MVHLKLTTPQPTPSHHPSIIGNWAADLEAGSKFGYSLLFVILVSNFMAVALQTLCIKLGIITGMDLAQACKSYYRKEVNWFLYALAEIAIIATDVAEVIGTAIALKLLFGWSTWVGVLRLIYIC